ncbi:hypothetical protein [Cytobacillus praedii]|uniref:Phage protein n=1 Tax=Cytobacillus praedii TaxID=1742358 RepID=A0A4R1AP39_9BACI|nr:hypothetical protein [Cytobacillus praedii]TCJ01497.1 hypothetical protein E0Y62_23770 [Cytobacillus praedii]
MNIRELMGKATAAVEFMYDKQAIIKRHEAIEKPNGADGMDWVIKHENLPCRLSITTLNNTDQGVANIVQHDEKLFLSSSYDVLAGDVVIVDGVEYESAKKPFVYVSHQEVLLIYKGYA